MGGLHQILGHPFGIAVHQAQIGTAARCSAIASLAKQPDRCGIIFGYAIATIIHAAQVVTAPAVPTIAALAIIADGNRIILWNAPTPFIHKTKVRTAGHIAAFTTDPVQPGGIDIICGNEFARFILPAQFRAGISIPLGAILGQSGDGIFGLGQGRGLEKRNRRQKCGTGHSQIAGHS